MKINIIVPFINSKTMVPVWAFEEDIIDFKNQHELAARCTCSYAAIELEKYLKKTLSNVDISIDELLKNDVELNINLIIENYSSRNPEFFIQPNNNGITISGKGRTGLLYGVYEFLRMQGWRWHSLDNDGDLKSTTLNDLVLPATKESFKPSMNKGRGFDFEQIYSKESIRLWKWMSRNRLNIVGYRENTAALCNKLGMQYKNGGHIFEKCLDPDRILTSGKTVWEEHRNWYGQGPNGDYSKETALSIQFCVSNDELIEFLGNYLLQYLTGEWKYADRVDIWGFDTWGQTCNCKNCKALGNSTDQNLHFISKMRNFLNNAKASNKLDHDVSMIFCGYEGTCTLQGPTKPIPQNIIDADDMMVYYPIRKCYAHDFSDESCKMNKFYKEALESWFNKKSDLPIIIGEYYNVSKFEDLPLVFINRLTKDLPYYYKMGIRGTTYMHVPLLNWGMRTLTQVLYAELSWNINVNTDEVLNDYYNLRYGPYKEDMIKAYDLVEKAWKYCADWRAWGKTSILTLLRNWDGRRPKSDKIDNHFKTISNAIKSGEESIRDLEKAKTLVEKVLSKDRNDFANSTNLITKSGVNPDEVRALKQNSKYYKSITDAYISIIYALDSMKLTTDLSKYYEAFRVSDNKLMETVWKEIEITEKKMQTYYIPIKMNNPSPGFDCLDALSRTQLQIAINRARKIKLTEC